MAEVSLKAPITTKPKRKKKHLLRKLIIAFIVLVLLASACYYAYVSLKQEYTVTYTSYSASIGSISNALSFSGSLALIDNQTYTASGSATVRTVYIAAGDNVKTGDKLLRLSNGETIKADFDGRVNALSVAEGDTVNAGDSLVQVADFSHMKVSIRVDEYDIAHVSVGQPCRVTATATEKQFDTEIATIDYISASTGNVAYYTATAYVDVNQNEGVYPGMQVTVTVPQEEAENVVVLNMNALSFDETNSAFVYMADENGTMMQVPVEVGVSNGNYVEIRGGLNNGDTVYVETKIQTASNGLAGLMQSFFGSQRVMPGNGFLNRQNGNYGNPDFGTRDFNRMPGGNNGGGR